MALNRTTPARNAGVHIGKVVRMTADGPYVELPRIARGFQLGPLTNTVTGLAAGDKVILAPLAHDPDSYVVLARVV